MKQLLRNSLFLIILILPLQLLANASIEKAYQLLLNKQYLTARNAYYDVIDADSTNINAYIGAIESSLALKHLDRAKVDAGTALICCSPNRIFASYLGYINYLEGNNFKSIHYYKTAILGSADRSIELTGLGMNYIDLHYLSKAEGYLRNALKVNSNNYIASQKLDYLEKMPFFTSIYSGYSSSDDDNVSYFGSTHITMRTNLISMRYNHFESDDTKRDSYSLGYKFIGSGWKSGIDLTYISGDYKLLYDTYGGSVMYQKEFINQYGYNRLGYAFSYFYYDILSTIQNTIWYETKLDNIGLKVELSSSIRDYEVEDMDDDYWLFHSNLIYYLPYNFTPNAYVFWGDKEFYVSPTGYVIDNHDEPILSYGLGLKYSPKSFIFSLSYTINDDTYAYTGTVGYKFKL